MRLGLLTVGQPTRAQRYCARLVSSDPSGLAMNGGRTLSCECNMGMAFKAAVNALRMRH